MTRSRSAFIFLLNYSISGTLVSFFSFNYCTFKIKLFFKSTFYTLNFLGNYGYGVDRNGTSAFGMFECKFLCKLFL